MSAVVHLKRDPYDVRIDRRTPWGNPFILKTEADRPVVIQQFHEWATTSDDPEAQWIREHVHELRGKVLGCWCGPKACHGDVLVEMAKA